MNRRQFLGGMGALFCAPAIVKAEHLMKIQVPPPKRIIQLSYDDLPPSGFLRFIGADFGNEEETVSYIMEDGHLRIVNAASSRIEPVIPEISHWRIAPASAANFSPEIHQRMQQLLNEQITRDCEAVLLGKGQTATEMLLKRRAIENGYKA